MARLDPPAIHPWKTENEQKKVNDLILDDTILAWSAIAGRHWRRLHLNAVVLIASSRSIEAQAVLESDALVIAVQATASRGAPH